MKICPGCREEFLEHMIICAACDQALIDEIQALQLPKKERAREKKEELIKGETVIFIEGSLSNCREIESILERSQVGSLVYPVNLTGKDDLQTLGSSGQMEYMLLVRLEDISAAKAALQGHFHAQVEREGQGEFVSDTIDLGQDMITCPACGETGELKDKECQYCGLTLGVDED